MEKKVTWNNIKSFLEGYKNFFLLELGMKPDYIKEQVAYRMEVCKNDCMIKRECIMCGCKVPHKMTLDKSCNLERFPNMMNEEDWNKYKESNGIN